MRVRIAVCAVLLALSPGVALAAQGILLVADRGTPEWNTQLTQLAAAVDKQRPTELALWSATNADVQTALDRLVQRGASEVVVVPLFVAASSSDVTARLTSPVPLRVSTQLNGDPVAAEIVSGRAREISRNPASEVLVLASTRSTSVSDRRWVPELAASARELNRRRLFAAIVTTTLPPPAAEASGEDATNLRRVLDRHIGMGHSILVVPILTPYGGVESAVKEQLGGVAHQMAASALLPDERLIAWIVSRADAAPQASR